MGQESVVGRQPFFYVEIDLDRCSLTYGVLPCTASAAAGLECYNTFITCQDRANYANSIETLTLSTNRTKQPIGGSMFPCIEGDPLITPTRLEIENGIGQRGSVSIKVDDFPHNDVGFDNYLSTRPLPPAGTFFNKLRRRNAFYQNRPFRLISGYLSGGAIVDTTTRAYLIDTFDGVDKQDRYSFTAKDVLKLADDKAAICPREVDAEVFALMNTSATNLIMRSGDGARMAAAIAPLTSGTIKIDDEIISFGVINVDTLQSMSRGIHGTTAASHQVGTKVDSVKRFLNTNVVDVIDELLTTFAGVASSYIPTAEWALEKTTWLSSNTLTKIISTPQKVSEILKELCIQNSLSLWYNEIEQVVKMSASSVSLGNQTPQSINDIEHILLDSLTIEEDRDTRLSQIWIFFDPINEVDGLENPDNFNALSVFINPDFESDNANGAPRIERIYAHWLGSGNAAIVPTMASRLLSKDLTQTFKLKFSLDAKDAELWTGQHALMDHEHLTGVSGHPEVHKIHITQVKESEAGHRFDYIARSKPFDPLERFAFIALNTLVSYATATDTEKAENAFISDGALQFPDGGSYYSITG